MNNEENYIFDTAANPNTTPANEELMREDAIDNSK
jgi:hypothetical protein